MTQPSLFETDSPDGAVISADERYRYLLWRQIMAGADMPVTMTFVMLNPSTADASVNDATIRVCLRLADREGATRLEVVNLYALRARDPKVLVAEAAAGGDPWGPENFEHIKAAIARSDILVGAWSGKWAPVARHGCRPPPIARWSREAGKQLYCLGEPCTDKAGSPRHPLYTKTEIALNPYPPEKP